MSSNIQARLYVEFKFHVLPLCRFQISIIVCMDDSMGVWHGTTLTEETVKWRRRTQKLQNGPEGTRHRRRRKATCWSMSEQGHSGGKMAPELAYSVIFLR
jgi:hypothetical protein